MKFEEHTLERTTMGNRNSRGISREKLTSFLALLSFTAYMPVSSLAACAVDIPTNALPDLNKGVNGDVRTDGSRMDVAVKGGKGTVGQFDWNSFNIGKDAQVNFEFTANNQTALNRVLSSGGISHIYGKMTSSSASGCDSCVNTSKVILINPSGILFGNGSSVNLNSFTASTYDIKGAKDLSKLSEAELKAYAGDVKTSGSNGGLFDIAGYNKTVHFVANDNMVDGNGFITGDVAGSKLASIVTEGSNITANKSLAFVGNKIDINGTQITTTYDSVPNASNGKLVKSNVKLVTGDGVNFYYTSAGNIDDNVTINKGAAKTGNQEYGVSISDSTIRTGNFLAYNSAEAKNSSVDINDSTIYTKKLLGANAEIGGVKYDATQTGTDGNINIHSDGSVNINKSDIQTTNDLVDGAKDIGYGNMSVTAKKDINIKNTQLRTADSSKNTAKNVSAGNITISSSEGNVNLVQDLPTDSPLYKNTAIASAGDLKIAAAGKVNIDGYEKIQAVGHGAGSSNDRTITVEGSDVNFSKTLLNAKTLKANAKNNLKVEDSTIVVNDTSLAAKDTTIDNSLLQYNNLGLKGDVTIKNDATFNDKDSDGLSIVTDGNLTLDNSQLQKKAYGSNKTSNQKSVSLESGTGNVTIQNGTHIVTENGGISVKASKGGITVDNSFAYANGGNISLDAKNNIELKTTDSSKVRIFDEDKATARKTTMWAHNGNLNLNSKEGKVSVQKSNISAEGGDTTISQALDMALDSDFANSEVGASGKLTLKTKGNVKGKTFKAGNGYINNKEGYTGLVGTDESAAFIYSQATIDAGKDIDLSNVVSAKNVDFVAGNDIDLASTTNMSLTNVSVKAGNTSNVAAAAKLTTDGFTINGGKKTTLSGKTVTTKGDSVIATKGNKLAVNADEDINIAVTGVNNAKNGLDVNADVNTSKGSEVLKGKNVTVRAADGTLAISKIKSDTLNITANEILAGETKISTETDNVSGLAEAGVSMDSKGYIEVRTDGGFNLDTSTTYDSTGKVGYTGGNYGSTTETSDKEAVGDQYDVTVEGETVKNSELVDSKTSRGKELGREQVAKKQVGSKNNGSETINEYEVTDEVTYEETTTKTYKDTETTTKTTTTYQDYEQTTKQRDGQHVVTLNDKEQNGFVLVYGKTSSKTDKTTEQVGQPKTFTDTVVTNDARTETETGTTTVYEKHIETETVPNPVDPDVNQGVVIPDVDADEAERVSNLSRIPRHSEGTSNAAPVQNNLADTSSTVVAAAARLQIEDTETQNDDEDDFLE